MVDARDTGPLTWNVPITDVKTGRPTPEFQRKWEQQRSNNSLIGSANTGTGAPTGIPNNGDEYIDTSVTPYVLYVGNGGAWHQVSARVFLDLADVPPAYIADGIVQVNASGDALEFNTPSTYTANPTATASDTVVNGSASTFMRSDAAPAVQLASSSQFGIVKVDGTTITESGGVISSSGGGGGFQYEAPFVKPVLADFSVTRNASGVWSDETRGIRFTTPGTSANANSLAYQLSSISTGAGGYEVILRMRRTAPLLGPILLQGIILRNSGDGKSVMINTSQDSDIAAIMLWYFDSDTAANGRVYLSRLSNTSSVWVPDMWLKIVDDLTTRSYYFSPDGILWENTVFTEGHTSFVTPDQVGIVVNNNSNDARLDATVSLPFEFWSYEQNALP